MTGRVSTWPAQSDMAHTYVGVEYAMKVMGGETSLENGIDKALVGQLFTEYAGVPVTARAFKGGDKVYPNILMCLMGYITY